MQRGELPRDSQILTEQLWSEIARPELASAQASNVAMDHIVSELTSLTEHRRLRQHWKARRGCRTFFGRC